MSQYYYRSTARLTELEVAVKGVISDGEETIGSAVAFVFPGVPHQLCQFHYLKDAIKPLYEADQHAKTQLKKQLRGVRPIERAEDSHKTAENEAIRGYCLAVRASLTDDGRSPLQAAGLRLYDRITQVSDSIARAQEKKDYPPLLKQLQHLLTKGMKSTASLWSPLESAYKLVHQAAQILANHEQYTGTQVRERYLAFVRQMQQQKAAVGPLGEAMEHFCHITENFAAGLFQCYDVEGLPGTNNALEHCFGVAAGLFLGWWSVVPFASSLPWPPVSRLSLPKSFAQVIISAGATCVHTCSSVKKPAGSSSASAKILPLIWRLWKLNFSREVCH